MKKIDIRKVFPYTSIEKDCLVNFNGEIIAGYQLILPEIFKYSEKELHNFHQSFANAIKQLPPGVIFHQQNFIYEDVYIASKNDYSAYDKSSFQFQNGSPLLRHYCNIYISYPTHNSSKSIFQNSLLSPMDYFKKSPFKDYKKRFGEFSKIIRSLEVFLNDIPNLSTTRLTGKQLKGCLYDYFNGSYDIPNTDLKETVLQPFTYDDGLIYIGDTKQKVISLVEEGIGLNRCSQEADGISASEVKSNLQNFKKIPLPTSYIYPLSLGLPFKHILNVTIEILDKDRFNTELSASKQGLNTFASFKHAGANRKQLQIEAFLKAIEKEYAIPCKTSLNVIVQDKDTEKLDIKVEYVKNAFSKLKDASGLVENYDAANLFYLYAPGNSRLSNRTFYSTVEQSTCYFQKDTNYLSDPKGLVLQDLMGNFFNFELINNKVLDNRNGLIIGFSGKGKSYLVSTLIMYFLMNNEDIVTTDIDHSYFRIYATFPDSIYLSSDDLESLAYPLFLCPKDENGKYDYKPEEPTERGKEKTDRYLNFIVSILKKIWLEEAPYPKPGTAVILKRSVTSFYDYVNENDIFPTLNEYYKYTYIFEEQNTDKGYIDFDDFRLLLREFVEGGEYEFLFNKRSEIPFVHYRAIGFDLKAVSDNNPKLFSLLSMTIMHLTREKERLCGRDTHLICDEVLDFLKDPTMGDFIGGVYRKKRKNGGGIFSAFQKVTFLDEIPSEICSSMTANSDQIWLCDHRSRAGDYPHLERILGLNKEDLKKLAAIQHYPGSRTAFAKIQNTSFLFRNYQSPFGYATFTTSKKDKTRLSELFKKYKHWGTAVNKFAEEYKELLEQESNN